ncbi:MAG: hypothetical protein QM211_05020 [Bacillota bacterium]|nr:hypothetical protein [Bacillota bacterium]
MIFVLNIKPAKFIIGALTNWNKNEKRQVIFVLNINSAKFLVGALANWNKNEGKQVIFVLNIKPAKFLIGRLVLWNIKIINQHKVAVSYSIIASKSKKTRILYFLFSEIFIFSFISKIKCGFWTI